MFLFVTVFYQHLSMNQVLFFLILYNIVSFFNTFGEELGWRGYLQANLNSLKRNRRFLLLGIMWELWHLPMRIGAIYNGANYNYILMFSLGTFVITYIIGIYVERTKSVCVAISLHATINSVLSLSSLSKIPQEQLLPYFLLVLLLYILVYFLWDKLSLKSDL